MATRLTKELKRRGIIFEDEMSAVESGRDVFAIVGDFLITVYYASVIDPQFHIYDRRTLEPIGGQNVYPEEYHFNDSNDKWYSFTFEGGLAYV